MTKSWIKCILSRPLATHPFYLQMPAEIDGIHSESWVVKNNNGLWGMGIIILGIQNVTIEKSIYIYKPWLANCQS